MNSSSKQKIEFFLNNPKVEKFIVCLIFLNIIVFVFQTDANINQLYSKYFNIIETFSVIIFTVEYLLRLLTLSRIKEIFSFYMVVDLLAILPFYLSFIKTNTIVLRILRIFRLLRVAKIARYSNAIENIKNAFIKRKNELIITGFIFITAVFVFATCIYYAENKTGAETFKSIPSSFWWAVITVTSVGYGDSYPVTTTGKFIAAITSIFGVGLHGLVIGVISTALMDVINHIKLNNNQSK